MDVRVYIFLMNWRHSLFGTKKVACALLILGTLTTTAISQTPEIAGTYVNESGHTKVRMSDCGAGVCGTIIWMNDPVDDVNNPDVSKRDRPVVGIQAVTLKSTGPGTYAGTLYDPESGKTYSGKAKLSDSGVELSGCVLGGLICKTAVWRRE